jgi:hypothetical protein
MCEVMERTIIGEGMKEQLKAIEHCMLTGCLPESCRGRNPKATVRVAAPGRLFHSREELRRFDGTLPQEQR